MSAQRQPRQPHQKYWATPSGKFGPPAGWPFNSEELVPVAYGARYFVKPAEVTTFPGAYEAYEDPANRWFYVLNVTLLKLRNKIRFNGCHFPTYIHLLSPQVFVPPVQYAGGYFPAPYPYTAPLYY